MAQHFEDLQSPNRWISIDDFEFLCFNATREFLSLNEPIPDFNTRNHALLESALASPMHTFDGKPLYPTLSDKASILFYTMIKNHPFENGNKRIAVITLLLFLSINNKWIRISNDLLYELAMEVANSKPQEKDAVLGKINDSISQHLIPIQE